MTTLPTSFFSEILDYTATIPEGKLAYFRERLRHKFYDFIVGGFLEKEKKGELNRAQLARRINKKPEQITRWLASPGNWEVDTLSDLVLAIFAGELDELRTKSFQLVQRNSTQLDYLNNELTPQAVAARSSRLSQKVTHYQTGTPYPTAARTFTQQTAKQSGGVYAG